MIQGSLVALATPMFENGDLDWENLDKLVDFHLKKGTRHCCSGNNWRICDTGC